MNIIIQFFIHLGGALLGIVVQTINCVFIMRLFDDDDNEKVANSNRTSDTILLNGSSNVSIHTHGSMSSNNPSYNLTDSHRYGAINSSTQSLNTKQL